MDIRKIEIDGRIIGGENYFPFYKDSNFYPHLAIELQANSDYTNSPALKNFYTNDFYENFNYINKLNCNFICLDFENCNLKDTEEKLIYAIKNTKKTIITKNNSKTENDLILCASDTAKSQNRQIIIGITDEKNYEKTIPSIVKNNHTAILQSPIDINLAKELNILTTDMGLNPDKILMDTNMGALGYGFDYGFSIIEKTKQASFSGDNMLNMPIISFIGSETFKAKEAKVENIKGLYGDFHERAAMWEIQAVTSIIEAGANLIVIKHPKTLEVLNNLIQEFE